MDDIGAPVAARQATFVPRMLKKTIDDDDSSSEEEGENTAVV